MKIVALIFLIAFPAMARADSYEFARGLGSLLAAEKPCEMHYDQSAVRDFIQKNVSDSNINFSNDLIMATTVASSRIRDMSDTALIAFCAQQVRVARASGFIK